MNIPTLDYIEKNMIYDMVIDGTLNYHGNIDYVSSHFGDGTSIQLTLSKFQPEDIRDIINEYLEAKSTDPTLTLTTFYERRAI